MSVPHRRHRSFKSPSATEVIVAETVAHNEGMRAAGLILAAGRSSRMGRPKALLELDQRSFLERLLCAMAEAGLADVVVVTGEHDLLIRAHLSAGVRPPGCTVRVVTNPTPERGQLSSLLVALEVVETLPDRVDAVVVTPVDHPRVGAGTIRALLDAASTSGAPVTRPVRAGRHGHPVVFGREAFEMLRAAPLEQGARAVVRGLGPRVCEVEIGDPGIDDDIDTPEDYRRLQSGA